MWEAAQATDEAKRSFQNGVLGETWIEIGEAPDWQRLYERREGWRIGTVPGGGLFLTAGADVQKDRIEVSIWAWARPDQLARRPYCDRRRSGEPSELGRTDGPARADLAACPWRTAWHRQARRRHRLSGSRRLCVGARGRVCQVAPVKGVEGFNRAAPVAGPSFVDATERGRKIRRGARLWTIAVATFKSETYRSLGLPLPRMKTSPSGILVQPS